MTGVSTGERCQPTRGVINPHRSAGRHLFRFSYYSFYKRARTKRHTEVIPQQKTNQSWKWKVWQKEDKAHTLASQGYQSLITWFKQSERTQRRVLAQQRSCSRRGDKQVHSGVNWTQSGTKLKAAELWMKTSSPLFVFLLTIFHLF